MDVVCVPANWTWKKKYVKDVDFLRFFRQTDVWRWQFPPSLQPFSLFFGSLKIGNFRY